MSETILSLNDITVFQEKNPILTNVSLDVTNGDFIYLIGKTGSGKSSFLKTLYADLFLT
jgi:cell division transport system ATP-binding protein